MQHFVLSYLVQSR